MLRLTFLLIVAVCAFSLCFYMILQGVNPILASALTGLIASLPKTNNELIKNDMAGISYCVSFAAIGVKDLVSTYYMLILLVGIIVILFELFKKHFNGWGGKLGATAFIGTGIFITILKVL